LSEELCCVADGVGGWNRKGVDPGIFSRELSARMWAEYARIRASGGRVDGINIRQLLIDQVAKT
jgi:serine/threonine protein phosphatase PrpC